MFAKNERRALQSSAQAPPAGQGKPHSLRLRLVLWYGMLVAVALSFFALLVFFLVADALNQGIVSSVHAEARVAELQVKDELLAAEPYWPAQIALKTLDTYQEPGVVIEVIDVQGTMRYDSDGNNTTRIPISAANKRAVQTGQTVQYQASVDGGQVQVEAWPLHPPAASEIGHERAPATSDSQTSTLNLSSANSPVIGLLLVAKSRSEIQRTLFLVQTLLLSVGIATLVGTLIGGWAIAARVLSPLSEMAMTARAVAATTARGTRIGDLHQRIRRPPGRDEMAQVIDTLNDMLADLERATYAQRRFVADASHELRAPLTTIQGNLAFLQRHIDDLPPSERHTMLSDAYEETLRLAQLVEQLLLLARADASMDGPSPLVGQATAAERSISSPVELDHIVLQLVRQLRGRLATEETNVNIVVGHIEPIRVHGDEEALRRIMLILLDNAIKYTPTSIIEKGEGRVTVSLERKEREAVLHIRDTGMGIDPADLPHIFERFYRADRARVREGTGLGLSIAHTLVIQLNGRITAESVLGQGSTFRVWLPLA
jgi:two-component system OmpR family sensor kinase